MTRIKHLLLAGTLAPSLLLGAQTPGFPQSPDQGDRHPRRHQDGGPGGEDHPRAQNREDRPPQREMNRGERREGGARQNGRDEHREDRRPGTAEQRRDDKRMGNGERNPRNPGGDQGREERRPGGEQRRDEPRMGAGERRDERRPGNEERRDDRRMGDDQRRPSSDERRNEQRLGGEQGRDRRRPGAEERHDERRLGGDQRRDERRPGSEERRNDQRLGGEQRRDEPPMGNGERRDDRRIGNGERRPDGPGAAVGIAGGGFGGGFLPPTNARRIDDLRRDRREVREGDRTFIREPGRTIVQERGRSFIVHDEVDRYRALGLDVRRERRGNQFYETARRPNGDVIITITDDSGRMLRRLRRDPGGREVVLIDNGFGGGIRPYAQDIVVLPPPQIRIPRDRYIVDYGAAAPALIYDTLIAPPLAPPPQRYTLDQIRYSPDIRNYVRQVDINTINFDPGSWEVPHAADSKLQALADAISRAIERNPNSVFLIEGYTDATGNANDNLSLSDRRAQSVAEVLSKEFRVPPENLTTQGYGQQNLKEDTQGPSAANRRVVVRNITQLLAAGGAPTGH